MNDLLLLHGALGARTQLQELESRLATTRRVHRLDFAGHGAAPIGEEETFRIERFAGDLLAWLDAQSIPAVDIFGYSMGGYVALQLARIAPERVGSIATLGTKFRWSPEIAARETKMLDAEKIEQKVPHFARALDERHTALSWKSNLAKTAEMMHALGASSPLGNDELSSITHRVRIGVGDRDSTVSVEESCEIFRLLPNAELEVMPGTQHPLEKVNIERLAGTIREFVGEYVVRGT
jgi:pimeloyl-ACP methyl ester carboxylesterase